MSVFLKFNTTTKAKASNSTTVPLKDGQFLILTDTKQLTYDYNGARLTLGDIEEVASKSTVVSPVDKFYYETSTGILWRYTAAATVGEQWKSWTNSEEFEAHLTATILDTNGVHGMKYDSSTKTLYYYNTTTEEWLPILTGGFTSYTKVLYANLWDANKEQEITVTGLTAYSNGIVGLPQDVTDEQYEVACDANLKVSGQTDDTLTIKAMGEVPDIDIPVSIVLFVDTIGGGGVSPEIIGNLADLTTIDKTNIVAAINEVNDDKLGIVTVLPTASATYENVQYLYVGASSGGFVKGTIYECQSDGENPPTYTWVAISTAEIDVATPTVAGLVKPDDSTIKVITDGTINVNTNVIASVSYVQAELSAKADLSSPIFVGVPTAPTASDATSTTQLATTQFVHNAVTSSMSTLGTAAQKDYTDVVRPNNYNLVESNAVYSAINTALSSIYTPRGDITVAELTSSLLVAGNVGNVYELSDSGTTTNLFL